jgi:N-acetylmuramoyl-L-alanine amidase
MNSLQVLDIQGKIWLHSVFDCDSMPFMKGYLHHRAGCIALAVLAIAPLCAAHAVDVKSARVWAGSEYTRVVLDASGPLKYTIDQQNGQVLVDIADGKLASGFSVPAAQGLYRGMRQERQGSHLQLTAKIAPSHLKSFVLAPSAGNNYRLVLDLYPDSASAPVASGVQKSALSAPVASHAVVSSSRRVAAEQAAAMLGGQRSVVVCIDPGHGGKDQGAHGPGGTLEKNVTLAVARDLAARINRQPGMKAVLTREGDYFIPLKRRYQIARDNSADLFVSIHADSFTRNDAKGSSVWVLSPRGKTSEAARWLADGQNRADLIGGTTLDDKNDDLAKVLLDLQQGWAMQSSGVVADNVLRALGQLGPTHRGYVERANFVVLRSPDVPSILVETAFISNPAEERRLRDPGHQEQLAQAVMGGLKNYFESNPPRDTWFAAQAARRNGVELASGKRAASGADDAQPSAQSVAAADASTRADANVRDLHRVGHGESLRSIARQYGISVGALKSANRINADTVRAGTVLTIPTG